MIPLRLHRFCPDLFTRVAKFLGGARYLRREEESRKDPQPQFRMRRQGRPRRPETEGQAGLQGWQSKRWEMCLRAKKKIEEARQEPICLRWQQKEVVPTVLESSSSDPAHRGPDFQDLWIALGFICGRNDHGMNPASPGKRPPN